MIPARNKTAPDSFSGAVLTSWCPINKTMLISRPLLTGLYQPRSYVARR
jgi:hypothetical protein